MIRTVMLGGQQVKLDPSKAIGKGGEADVYRLDAATALKIFKQPDHPDLAGMPDLQKQARERLARHQAKLRSFPIIGLPDHVVQPLELALVTTTSSQVTNPGSTIGGYSMRLVAPSEKLIRYSEADFRQGTTGGVGAATVTQVFLNLHGIVAGTHKAGVVIGDFNNLNVLIQDTEPYLIDIDSAQFGKFDCVQFTARFLDPTLASLGPDGKPMLAHRHNPNSDWYAFTAMLMESLLLVHPYLGVYRPKNKPMVSVDRRPLERISVFDPDVRYPKIGIRMDVLSDDLLSHFQQVFSPKDIRGVFPRTLLENLRWTTCPQCGTQHARRTCPACAFVLPVVKPAAPQVVHGTVTARRVFAASESSSVIITATVEDNKLLYLYTNNIHLYREDGSIVGGAGSYGGYDSEMRVRLTNNPINWTLIGKGTQVASFAKNNTVSATATDRFAGATGRLGAPVFDANSKYVYWSEGGRLWRNGVYGHEDIGRVLQNQTMFWVGQDFGFGFYRAGPISQAFVFGATDRLINDNVDLSPISGELIDATTIFGRHRAWFMTSSQEGEQIVNRCTAISDQGKVEGIAEATRGDGSWLGALHSACATGPYLLVATDDGIVRVEVVNGRVEQTRAFPDTEPFVSAGSMLLPGPGGIYVVDRKEIRLITIN